MGGLRVSGLGELSRAVVRQNQVEVADKERHDVIRDRDWAAGTHTLT